MCDLSAKEIFDLFHKEATKRFGQNFLFNESVNRKIVSFAGSLTSKIVAEVGPGPGGLTLEILKQDIKKLYVIEYDKYWAEIWRQLQPRFNKKLEVIECDALTFDMTNISPQVIISNLPYNISTQLLFKWMPRFDMFEKLILMFQKEVAERICASCGTKAYGKLSVLAQWKSRVEKKFSLKPGNFMPPPKVESTVVEFIPFSQKHNNADFRLFSRFLTDIFAHRRKVAAKSIGKYCESPEEVLEKLGFAYWTRADEISVNSYLKMFNLIFSKSIS